jgi:hypothetical protein
VPEEGFPSRGIKSDLGTATEKPGDWVDYHINPGMKKLPSFIQDTDNMLQNIEKINEKHIINDKTNLLCLDVVDMYNRMPRELSEVGMREYLETRKQLTEQPSADSVLSILNLCAENNTFQFKEKMYRQKSGFAIGQKYSPPAACLGAGVSERIFHNLPRSIVYDDTPHGMNKDKNDCVFWSVKDMFLEWLRYIDDCFTLFQGDKQKADWFVEQLNNLFPGELQFTFEYEEKSLVFLDLKICINRDTNQLEVDKHIKPTNTQLYLNYRSCHPPHIFKSIVYSQALTAFQICSRDDWRNIHF